MVPRLTLICTNRVCPCTTLPGLEELRQQRSALLASAREEEAERARLASDLAVLQVGAPALSHKHLASRSLHPAAAAGQQPPFLEGCKEESPARGAPWRWRHAPAAPCRSWPPQRRLAQLEDGLEQKRGAKEAFDRVITQTEQSLAKIVESSSMLLTVAKRSAAECAALSPPLAGGAPPGAARPGSLAGAGAGSAGLTLVA